MTILFRGEEAFFCVTVGENGGRLFYSKPLWGGEVLGFEAPSLRSIVDIGVNIVVAAATGGSNLLLSAALNLIDDAVFTMADIGTGMEWDEALVSFGKKAVTSFASAATGDISGGLTDGLGNGFGDVLIKTL
ncbi:MAG TPA: hypothetical protein ENN69_03180, partial [Spirochaetia bacterium]|nr:hypothetical protein [Spirochaetia bacterium]